jgi:hypothetical protein
MMTNQRYSPLTTTTKVNNENELMIGREAQLKVDNNFVETS